MLHFTRDSVPHVGVGRWTHFTSTLLLVLGALLGGVVVFTVTKQDVDHHDCPRVYRFIHQDTDCIDMDQLFQEISETQTILEKQILEYKAKGDATRVSVFYRDLSSNRWFGINENKSFAPGSLLKLPIAIAYLKLSEIEPSTLEQKIIFKRNGPSLNDLQRIKPRELLVDGATYSNRELITHMIEQSDNEPVPILAGGLDKTFFEKVYIDLGIYFPTSGGIEQEFVSVRTYAGILRTLYYSTYLNTKNSETLLETMARGDFIMGVKRGLDPETPYANKFGDRGTLSSDPHKPNMYQLHDCGIVYHIERPYIFCAMTEGVDFEKLEDVLSGLSRTVFERQ